MTDGSCSVVIPVFNSALVLPELVERLEKTLTGLVSAHEIILVNDDSRDNSWEIIEGLTKSHGSVRGINLMRNYGQHNALLCGIRAATGDIIVTMDDDLQHPPEEIPKLLSGLDEGVDVVYGYPTDGPHGVWRNLASKATKLALQAAMGAATARKASAFRAFRAKVSDAFAHYESPSVVIDVLLTWGTTRFSSVPVQHDPRRVGASNYTFRSLVAHAVNMMTGFSTLPLRLASYLGFAFTLFGLGLLTYVIIRYIVDGGSIPGFPFLASTIALFSGVQLFIIGIMGEYIARMHQRMMNRPPYATRVVSDNATEHAPKPPKGATTND